MEALRTFRNDGYLIFVPERHDGHVVGEQFGKLRVQVAAPRHVAAARGFV
jgi:predicted RNA-binding protein with TRAM domain